MINFANTWHLLPYTMSFNSLVHIFKQGKLKDVITYCIFQDSFSKTHPVQQCSINEHPIGTFPSPYATTTAQKTMFQIFLWAFLYCLLTHGSPLLNFFNLYLQYLSELRDVLPMETWLNFPVTWNVQDLLF